MNEHISTGADIASDITIREAYTEPNQVKDEQWLELVTETWVRLSALREWMKSQPYCRTVENLEAWLEGKI